MGRHQEEVFAVRPGGEQGLLQRGGVGREDRHLSAWQLTWHRALHGVRGGALPDDYTIRQLSTGSYTLVNE